MQTRREEVHYIKKMKLYNNVPVEECWNKTSKTPIQVRWIDVNKGDSTHPNYRSRLVAKEIKEDGVTRPVRGHTAFRVPENDIVICNESEFRSWQRPGEIDGLRRVASLFLCPGEGGALHICQITRGRQTEQ